MIDFFSLSFFDAGEMLEPRDVEKLRWLYEGSLMRVKPSFIDTVFAGTIQTQLDITTKIHPCYKDTHPMPMQHLEYLEKNLEMKFSDETVNVVSEYEETLKRRLKELFADVPTWPRKWMMAHDVPLYPFETEKFKVHEYDWRPFYLYSDFNRWGDWKI